MPDRHRRMKAQDVFNETDYPFGKASSFSEAFPTIADLRIEVEEYGDGVPEKLRKTTYTHHNFPGEYINCRNRRCYNGGFRLGELLRFMTAANKTESESTEFCQGYEGSPKGRVKDGPCENYFKVAITIEYKDA